MRPTVDENATPRTKKQSRGDARRAWALATAADLEARIRTLTDERRAVYRRMKAARDGGHLIPGTLTEEIADNEAALLQALARYRDICRPPAPEGAGRLSVRGRSDTATVRPGVRLLPRRRAPAKVHVHGAG
jgi:hypothetical protein